MCLDMHTIVFYAATVWTVIFFGVCIVLIIRALSAMTRVLALDTLNLMLIAILALVTSADNSTYYLDTALALALLAFVGTVAAARYYSNGRIFS